jgi:site-specific DNA-methyltransferase (adenine-specific)
MKIDLYHGDCLEVMKSIPDCSVDAIITDPPYGTMKGAALNGWNKEKTNWDCSLDINLMFEECNRILKINAPLILFSQEPYTSQLITKTHGNIPFSYRMIWLKDHFANALIAKKSPVFYFEDICVFFKKYDTKAEHPLRNYAEKILKHCNENKMIIYKKLGHQGCDHFFRINSTQFSLCTEITYMQLCNIYNINLESWFLPFSKLVEIDNEFSSIYKKTFNLPINKKYKSNVLEYKKDYDGFHPTQKPVKLIEDLIYTYTNESETVLDFTMGSGTTGVACKNLNRNFIGIELDEQYFNIAKQRINNASFNLNELKQQAKEIQNESM